MAMGVTILLYLRCVVIMLLLSRSAEALQRKASALNLASMSIYSTDLQLREQSSALVDAHCASQLDAASAGLHRASTQLVSDPDTAHHSLALVDAVLRTCAQSSLDLLSRVAQSVASAQHLINQLGVVITTRVENAAEEDQLVVDFCPDHVALTASSATIGLDRACGGKFHTRGRYGAGKFSVPMRAPQGAPGVSNSFYISSDDALPDSISFDFVGHEPHRVLTSYAVAENHSPKLKTYVKNYVVAKRAPLYRRSSFLS